MKFFSRCVVTALLSAGVVAGAGAPAHARSLVTHTECTISTSESTENPLSDYGFRDPVTGTSYLPGTGPIGEVSCGDDGGL